MSEIATPWLELGTTGVLILVIGGIHWLCKWLGKVICRIGHGFSGSHLCGRAVAEELLKKLDLLTIPVLDGAPCDHYDWRRKRLHLRTQTAVSSSVVAVAIASHEVGHVEQFSKRHWAARCVPYVWNGSWLAISASFAILLFDILIHPSGLLTPVLVTSCAVVILLRAPVVLAIEADASRRALECVKRLDGIDQDENQRIAKILHVCFWTHALLAGQQLACLLAAAVLFCGLEVAIPFPRVIDPSAISIVEVSASIPPPLPNEITTPPMVLDAEFNSMLLVMAAVDLLLLVAVGGVVVWVFRLFRGKPSKQSKRGIEWNNAGLTHYHAGRYAEALASIDRAMATDPSIATAHYNRAVVLAALGRWEESLASIDQFLTMPDADVAPLTSQADFWVFCASLHLAREQWLQAERALNEALGRKPKDLGSIYRDRCLVRLKLGRPEEAAKDGAEAVRRAPDDAVALNNFGVACSECGRFEEAIGLLERCIEWSSDFANPHRHLAWILATCPQPGLRDGARAVSLATRALELSQWTKTDWFDVLAAAYAEMGRVDEAIDWQQRHAQACLPGSTEKSASMERIKALEESRLISV